MQRIEKTISVKTTCRQRESIAKTRNFNKKKKIFFQLYQFNFFVFSAKGGFFMNNQYCQIHKDHLLERLSTEKYYEGTLECSKCKEESGNDECDYIWMECRICKNQICLDELFYTCAICNTIVCGECHREETSYLTQMQREALHNVLCEINMCFPCYCNNDN